MTNPESLNSEPLSEEIAPGDDARNIIDRLADSFIIRLRRGEHPSLSEYTDRYPELSDEIRDVFSTLVMLEQGGEEFLKSPPQIPDNQERVLDELGEYRILREVGRGGMGIVYEAEHRTMRRRVALKVLPAGIAPDDLRIKRFYLEARLAGRLHHTNIVPVFEVGVDGGYHYYAMQFIQGQSLDFIFSELRRLRGIERVLARAPLTEAATTLTHTIGHSIAWSLHSGPFQQRSAAMAVSETPAGDGRPVDEINSSEEASPSMVSASLNHSVAPADDYFRRVARIGLQVAEALQYAHAQGVLHRDIKPSNIILDTAGIAWVTDFGLAKKEDDDLTRSGDVVGTMRYMAPERFAGKTDGRSDLYGLGLTLYELCTLRNAFHATDRAQLIRDVCETEPVAPRSVDPQIPRDLETIILKAIEKQPARRYTAASQMTEDLRLFLSDHPIRSRRVSPAERLWRWCRRNPQQAVLATCVLILLLVVTGGSLAFGYLTSKHSVLLSESQHQATERLYESLRRSADAARWSHRPGQNVTSVQEIAHAAEVLPQLDWKPARVARETVELRNAAIAAIVLPDIDRWKSWEVDSSETQVTFDPTYEYLALAEDSGAIVIRTVEGESELYRLPSPPMTTGVVRMQFDPDGQYLGVEYRGQAGPSLGFWEIATGKMFRVLPVRSDAPFAFHPEDGVVAVANGNVLQVYRLANGEILHDLQMPEASRLLAMSASGDELAVLLAGERRIQIWDARTWQLRRAVTAPGIVAAMAWHPQSNQLTLGNHDGILQIYDVVPSLRVSQRFQGHSGRVIRLFFTPNGRHLISQSWDGTVRLWNVGTGDQLLRMEGTQLLSSGFSQPDARLLGTFSGSEYQLWKVTLDTPLQILRSPRPSAFRWSADIDPSGRWLVSARDDGVELWDLHKQALTDFLPSTRSVDGASKDAHFLPGDQGVLVSNGDGLQIVPLQKQANGQTVLQADAARRLRPTASTWASVDRNGRFAAIRHNTGGASGLVIDLQEPEKTTTIGPHSGLDHVELSPNGRWVVTTSWGGRGLRLWDAASGARLSEHLWEPYAANTNAIFSPDNQWLTASTPKYLVTWRTTDWQTVRRIRRPKNDDWPGPLAYSPDGRLLVAAYSRFILALLAAETGEEIALLDSRSNGGFHSCCISADGMRLAAASDTHIHVWNLQQLRDRLAKIGLDW